MQWRWFGITPAISTNLTYHRDAKAGAPNARENGNLEAGKGVLLKVRMRKAGFTG